MINKNIFIFKIISLQYDFDNNKINIIIEIIPYVQM